MRVDVVSTPEKSLVFTNLVYMNDPPAKRVCIGTFVFDCQSHMSLRQSTIGLNSAQRKCLKVEVGTSCNACPLHTEPGTLAKKLSIDVDNATSAPHLNAIDATELAQQFVDTFQGQHFKPSQQALMQHNTWKLLLTVKEGEGLVGRTTKVLVGSAHIPINESIRRFDFDAMGIGGLQHASDILFRRAFASRLTPAAKLQALGVRHVKGVLLHGPPGTGKTLIARKLSQHLTGIEPKVVNGPEVLNRFVGASEENIRLLFREAEDAQKKGRPGLHVIIFDEIDAICKERGQIGAHVGDSVVNQLLTKMDGVEQLDNIVVIGLTNRADLLDAALMRPGRFEVQIEITLPSATGRREILDIHTAKMRSNGLLSDSFDPPMLVENTKNFSGAEIEGLVKSAVSHAMAREDDDGSWRVEQSDFVRALREVRPKFGNDLMLDAEALLDNDDDLVEADQIFQSQHARVFFEHTETAISYALQHAAPYTRRLRGNELAILPTPQKIKAMVDAFEVGMRSEDTAIILDDLDLILDFCSVGPIFCNKTLQTIKALLQRQPRSGHRLYVFASGQMSTVQLLSLLPSFDTVVLT